MKYLTAIEEREKLIAWRDHGCQASRDALVESQRHWIRRLATAAAYRDRLNDADCDDLEANGLLMLVQAIDKGWEPDRGRLTTFIAIQFRQMKNKARWENRLIRVPSSSANMSASIKKAAKQLQQTRQVDGGDRADNWHPLYTSSPTERLEQADDMRTVERVMANLDQRQRTILWERAKGGTLSAIAKTLNVSCERVRQIEHGALALAKQMAVGA